MTSGFWPITRYLVMRLAPVCLIVFSLLHGSLSWSETRHLAEAGPDEWIQHLTTIHTRWLAIHLGGVALFPLLALTIWWMLPASGLATRISQIALVIYAPLYVAVDAVLGIGSSILLSYRQQLAPADRAGADGAFSALFFEPSPIDWLDQGASIAWKVGAFAAAIAVWRTSGWRVSLPLAVAGWALAKSHFPPYGAVAGLALIVAVWQHTARARSAGKTERQIVTGTLAAQPTHENRVG